MAVRAAAQAPVGFVSPFNGVTPVGGASYLLPRGGEADGWGGEPAAGGGCVGALRQAVAPFCGRGVFIDDAALIVGTRA